MQSKSKSEGQKNISSLEQKLQKLEEDSFLLLLKEEEEKREWSSLKEERTNAGLRQRFE